MTSRGVPSLDPVANEVRWERDAQLRHFDALDSKAGILLGFSGVLVALAGGDQALVLVGRLAAASSALTAMLAFWPRRYMATDVRQLRTKYLAAASEFARVHLLDTHIVMAEAGRDILLLKARLLKVATGILAVAIALIAVGLALD